MKTYPDFIIYQPLEDIDDYLDNDPDGLNKDLCEVLCLIKKNAINAKEGCYKSSALEILNDAYLWAKRIYMEKYPILSNLPSQMGKYSVKKVENQNFYTKDLSKCASLAIAYIILSLQCNLRKDIEDFLPEILNQIPFKSLIETTTIVVQEHKEKNKYYSTQLYPRMIYYRSDEIQEATNNFSIDGIERLLRIYNDKDEQLKVLSCIKCAYQKNHGEIIDLPF